MNPNTGQDTPTFSDWNQKGADHAPAQVGMNAKNSELAEGPWAGERKIDVTVVNSTKNLSLRNDTNRGGSTTEQDAPVSRIESKIASDRVMESSSSQIF